MIKRCKNCQREFIPKYAKQELCRQPGCVYHKPMRGPRTKAGHTKQTFRAKFASVVQPSQRAPLQFPAKKHLTPELLDKHYKLKYGLSLEDVQRMAEMQDNRCAICGSTGRLLVDHNHNTGTVRGLLCTSCNSGLGHFKDSISAIRRAASYLEERKG